MHEPGPLLSVRAFVRPMQVLGSPPFLVTGSDYYALCCLLRRGHRPSRARSAAISGAFSHRPTATPETSRGKFNCLRRTLAGSTESVLDGYGLRGRRSARPPEAAFIRFLFIELRLLISASFRRRRPCASLGLHLHQVVQGTCTPRLLNMLGTPTNARPPGEDSPAVRPLGG